MVLESPDSKRNVSIRAVRGSLLFANIRRLCPYRLLALSQIEYLPTGSNLNI